MKRTLFTLCLLVNNVIVFSQTNFFPASGNVGIGTTSPSTKLEIYNGSILVNYPRTSTGSIVPIAVGTQYHNGNSSRGLAGIYHIESGSSGFGQAGSLGLFTSVNDESPTEKVRISNIGNVGIGTTTPTSKLDIQGANGLTIFSDDGISATLRGRIGDNSSQIRFHDNANNLSAIFGHVGSELRFYTGGANQRMVITGGGNVGIGTGSPSATLEVENGSGSPEINARGSVNPLHVSTSTTNNVRTKLQSVGSESAGYVGTETNHQLRLIVANDPKVGINSNGNIGIGTLYPNSKLDVRNGKIIAGTANATGGSVVLEGQYDQAGTHGSLSVLGTNYSSGGWILGYGITPKPGVFNSFLSSTLASVGRSGIAVESDLRFLTSSVQSLAIGNDVAMVERMKITNEGNVGIGTTIPTGKFEISSSSGTAKFKIGDASGNSVNHLSWNTGAAINVPDQGGANPLIYFRRTDYNNLNSFTDVFQVKSDGSIQAFGQVRGSDIVSTGTNSWIFHTPDDGSKTMYIAPGLGATDGSAGWDWSKGIFINNDGSMGVGLSTAQPTGYKLAIGGDIIAERVVVKLQSNWPDYVFNTDYMLRPLSEVDIFLKTNNHLPDVPSEAEVKVKGIDVEQMNVTLLKKVEELTLYLIEQQKEIKALRDEVKLIKEKK